MPQPEFDPKTLVWYPLFSFILFLFFYIVFDVPSWIFFVVLFAVFLHFLVFIIIEINRKE